MFHWFANMAAHSWRLLSLCVMYLSWCLHRQRGQAHTDSSVVPGSKKHSELSYICCRLPASYPLLVTLWNSKIIIQTGAFRLPFIQNACIGFFSLTPGHIQELVVSYGYKNKEKTSVHAYLYMLFFLPSLILFSTKVPPPRLSIVCFWSLTDFKLCVRLWRIIEEEAKGCFM